MVVSTLDVSFHPLIVDELSDVKQQHNYYLKVKNFTNNENYYK